MPHKYESLGNEPEPEPEIEAPRVTESDLEANKNECTICLEEIDETGDNLKLNCGHSFHIDCIGEWITNNKNTCPNCRGSLDETFYGDS